MICPVCDYDNLPGSDQCEECLVDLRQEDIPQPGNEVQRSIMEDPISVLSPRVPISMSETSSLGEVVGVMKEENIGAMLVVDEKGALRGIFSERDLIGRVIGKVESVESTPVSEVMTPMPECRKLTDTLAYAIHSMYVGNYRHIPIVDKAHKPVGIVALSDIINFMESNFRDIVTRRFERPRGT
mgnify:CR=1 FL=1